MTMKVPMSLDSIQLSLLLHHYLRTDDQRTCSSPTDLEARTLHWTSVSQHPSKMTSLPVGWSSPVTPQASLMPGKSGKSELPAEPTGSSQSPWKTLMASLGQSHPGRARHQQNREPHLQSNQRPAAERKCSAPP